MLGQVTLGKEAVKKIKKPFAECQIGGTRQRGDLTRRLGQPTHPAHTHTRTRPRHHPRARAALSATAAVPSASTATPGSSSTCSSTPTRPPSPTGPGPSTLTTPRDSGIQNIPTYSTSLSYAYYIFLHVHLCEREIYMFILMHVLYIVK